MSAVGWSRRAHFSTKMHQLKVMIWIVQGDEMILVQMGYASLGNGYVCPPAINHTLL